MTTLPTIVYREAIARMSDAIGGKGPGTAYERIALDLRAVATEIGILADDPAIGDRERSALVHALQCVAQATAALDIGADEAFPKAVADVG